MTEAAGQEAVVRRGWKGAPFRADRLTQEEGDVVEGSRKKELILITSEHETRDTSGGGGDQDPEGRGSQAASVPQHAIRQSDRHNHNNSRRQACVLGTASSVPS